MKTVEFEKFQRILVIRLSSVGDILLTTPILRLLRTMCPEARIDVLVKTQYRDLLRAHPDVTGLLTFESKQSVRQILGILRRTTYDMVIDLHSTFRSRLFLWGSRSRYKLVYSKNILRRVILVHLGWNTLRSMTPVPELYAAPLRRLGFTHPLTGLEMHLEPGSLKAMKTYINQHLSKALPLLAIAPGATWPTKRWSVNRFAVVAQEMAQEMGAAIVVLGSQEEVPLTRDLCRQFSVPFLNSTGQLSLMHTAALLQHCRLLLCNDSGLMHMATALKVPVVSIFGPTVQEFGFYPFQSHSQVISHPLSCRPCSTKGSKNCPKGHHNCMQYITSEQVLSVVRNMWKEIDG